MKKLSIEMDGKSIEVLAQKVAGTLWVHHQGETFSYSPQISEQGQGSDSSSGDPTKIVAPMPGKIIKLLKTTGDLVEEGETIVVMEAMKMEYNLKALQPMKVSQISCQENETVNLGHVLVRLEPSDG